MHSTPKQNQSPKSTRTSLILILSIHLAAMNNFIRIKCFFTAHTTTTKTAFSVRRWSGLVQGEQRLNGHSYVAPSYYIASYLVSSLYIHQLQDILLSILCMAIATMSYFRGEQSYSNSE